MNKPRILLVDDDFDNRSLIKNALAPISADFFEITAEKNFGFLSRDVGFDLIIANLKTSLFDGTEESSKYFQQNPFPSSIPVILTGKSEENKNIKKSIDAGASAYIDMDQVEADLIPLVEKLCSKSSPRNSSGKKILVVDDSNSVRLMLQEGLKREGYQVITAENGKKALDVIRNTLPDLILSDVYMPEMGGIELCECLHENPLFSHIPFVVMSTENNAQNMKKMMQYGAAAFIIKPFNLEQLMMTLNKIFSYEFLLLLKEKERLDGEQKLLIAGITSLVKALEARDKYTRGHSERVSLILAGLVRLSGGTNYDVERAQIAGRLHDIGKIGIRDNVLLKPGRLSDDEFYQIKQHPSIGSSIIKTIPSISDILPVVQSHHERMDGKGYPQGLHGSEIPLWARMTAVADTYDALTTDRPYRKGLRFHQALEVINSVSGTQLCPHCVKLFFDWCSEDDPDNAFENNSLSQDDLL